MDADRHTDERHSVIYNFVDSLTQENGVAIVGSNVRDVNVSMTHSPPRDLYDLIPGLVTSQQGIASDVRQLVNLLQLDAQERQRGLDDLVARNNASSSVVTDGQTPESHQEASQCTQRWPVETCNICHSQYVPSEGETHFLHFVTDAYYEDDGRYLATELKIPHPLFRDLQGEDKRLFGMIWQIRLVYLAALKAKRVLGLARSLPYGLATLSTALQSLSKNSKPSLTGLYDMLGRCYLATCIRSRVKAKLANKIPYIMRRARSYLDISQIRRDHGIQASADVFEILDERAQEFFDYEWPPHVETGYNYKGMVFGANQSLSLMHRDSSLRQMNVDLIARGLFGLSLEDITLMDLGPSLRRNRLGLRLRFARIPGYSFEQGGSRWMYFSFPTAISLPGDNNRRRQLFSSLRCTLPAGSTRTCDANSAHS